MNTITMKGNELHLEGSTPKVGQKAPDFNVSANDLSPRTLGDYKDKVLILVAIPSLDTGVCDTEVRRFNKEAEALSKDISILTISCDLPFAQARWCGAAGVKAVESLSDHKDVSFGKNYGILIKELRLLARAIFVVDKSGNISYVEIVPELTNEPNYEAALAAAKKSL